MDRAAEQTRIRADYLMRMESDEFDFLAPAYVRGFLRSYARYLRVDPDPLLEEFDHRYGRQRTDPSQIVALDRRSRSLPRQRRPLNSWLLAAVLAAIVLIALAIVGVVTSPRRPTGARGGGPTIAEESPSATPSETPSVTPSPTESEGSLALDDGFSVEVVAKRARCWIEVTSDGQLLTPGGITLELGDRSDVFEATTNMKIVFGYAEGVDLIIDGQNLGAPGAAGPTVINIPKDVEELMSGVDG